MPRTKTIALSGATGFVGSHLSSRLLSQGHAVVALVRGAQQEAVRRLERAVRFADPAATTALTTGQLRVVSADLSSEDLGLDRADHRRLASEVDEVWHCAAHTDLHATPDQANRVNVEGTRRMLQLADASGADTRFVHVSTAFVAGDRREGLVGEEELDSSHGFVTPYEESKYRAEVLVRAWARDGRSALVLRPSTLVSTKPVSARGPRSTHAAARWGLSRLAARGRQYAVERFGAVPDAQGLVRLRFQGHQDALINITSVEYAADSAVRLAREATGPGTVTRHVVHPVDTPVRMWIDAIAAQAPWVRAEIVDDGSAPSALDRHLGSFFPGFDRYGYHRRRYERTALDRAEARGGVTPPPALSAAYLAAALSSPSRRTDRTPAKA
jgi:nucleoside-diphosphate-sugar epimerase